jgi:hypothetical protein
VLFTVVSFSFRTVVAFRCGSLAAIDDPITNTVSRALIMIGIQLIYTLSSP